MTILLEPAVEAHLHEQAGLQQQNAGKIADALLALALPTIHRLKCGESRCRRQFYESGVKVA